MGGISSLFRSRDKGMLGQAMRYILSGWTAFAIDFGTMTFFKEVGHLPDAVSATIGFAAGLVVTYLLSIYWIFDERRVENQIVEFIVFAFIGVVGLILTYYIMILIDRWFGLHYMVAKVITSALVTLWNFTAKKLLLFTKKKRP